MSQCPENPSPGSLFDSIVEHLLQHLEFLGERGISRIEFFAPIPPAKPVTPGGAPAASKAPSPASPPDADALLKIARQIGSCKKCALHESRTKTVPGQGCPRPEIMFIGEAPGEDEDRQGLAFVGAAGQLLTKIIQAMGLSRDDVFIGNILKCRPPGNRRPMPDEMNACLPYLKEQIALLKPKVIVALGATSVAGLLNNTTGISKLRGHWMSFEGIDVMPTFHPSYLLRNPSAKREVWEDMQAVLEHLGRTPLARSGGKSGGVSD